MRLKMGLRLCEVLIKGLLAKHLLRKLAPFSVGITVTSSTGVMLFQSQYVNAAPGCTNDNAPTPTSLSEASEEFTDPLGNIKSLKETECLQQSSSRIPALPFENAYSDSFKESLSPFGEPLVYPAGSPPEYENGYAFGVRQIKNVQQSPTSLVPLKHLQALEQDSLSCLTQKVAWKSTPERKELPLYSCDRKEASLLLGTEAKDRRDSLLFVEDFSSSEQSPFSLLTKAPANMPVGSESFTHKTFLQAQTTRPNPNEDRFLQPAPTPEPIKPETEPSIQPSPTPTPEPTQTEPSVQPSPTPAPEPTQTEPSVQPSPTPTPEPTQTEPSVQPSPTPTSPATPTEQTIQVKKINVTGSTIFGPDQLNPIVQPYEGRALTLEQLREVADKITQLYLDRGYITSRAILANQVVPAEGVVEIRVIEGSLEEIRIEGTRRVKPSYVRRRVQLGAGKPLNTGKLEDQLRLLRTDPLFENVEASLRAGTRVGQSILIVRVVEADPFEGSVGIDNYSPPSVGSERLGLNLLYRNLTGNGDTIAAAYYHTTTSGLDTFDFSYLIPLNPMNGTLQLRAAPNRNRITQESLSTFNIEGNSELYEISFRQPLIRSPREEFALSLGFTYQDGQTFLLGSPFPFGFGPEANGTSKTRVIKLGQDYLRRDVRGAWSLRSLFNIGIDVFDATTNPEPTPDGRFVSWLGQVQRVQILNENNFLIMGADIQLTPNSLLPSQQFVIGGGQSLRGYRQNIRSGDNGVRFSVEDRITLQRNEAGAAIFQLAPFFDAGVIWNKSNNPNNEFLPSQRFLAGIGLGLIWEPEPGLNLRLDYAYPLVDLKDRGDNAQDEGFHFSVRYQF